ncbi:putative inorganic phosphate transporter 1-9 [Camellia lanceoleosa]|uniref:Inorganic phosphate transporter 1-9 n=1 Tax=Camellia lanceoleosa TaxID=1840588 RepID=A0ACC0G8V3_9ERIC|nr:putative inorganic phosphate transporter 1-9 [Camellia lanceoleosa]
MEKVLEVSLSQIVKDVEFPSHPPPFDYPFLSKAFFCRHGRDLFSCAASWFMVNVVFYNTNLVQSQLNHQYLPERKKLNAYQDAYNVARFQALLALCSTISGY